MNYICPKCLGDGFTGWTQSKFRRKKRIYKNICLVCLGSGEVDWITVITQKQSKIEDSLALISNTLSRKLGNYCFFRSFNEKYFINEEYCKIKSEKEKWKHVRLLSSIEI